VLLAHLGTTIENVQTKMLLVPSRVIGLVLQCLPCLATARRHYREVLLSWSSTRQNRLLTRRPCYAPGRQHSPGTALHRWQCWTDGYASSDCDHLTTTGARHPQPAFPPYQPVGSADCAAPATALIRLAPSDWRSRAMIWAGDTGLPHHHRNGIESH